MEGEVGQVLTVGHGTLGEDDLRRLLLGGRRTPLPDSPNTGLRNTAFRGYADHMATEAFHAATDASRRTPHAPTDTARRFEDDVRYTADPTPELPGAAFTWR